jgi:hypothetical protein
LPSALVELLLRAKKKIYTLCCNVTARKSVCLIAENVEMNFQKKQSTAQYAELL